MKIERHPAPHHHHHHHHCWRRSGSAGVALAAGGQMGGGTKLQCQPMDQPRSLKHGEARQSNAPWQLIGRVAVDVWK